MHAIALLERQHEHLNALLQEFRESVAGDERTSTFKKLQHAFFVHMLLEEEIFYPTVVNSTPEHEPFAQGYEELAETRQAMTRCARVLDEEALFQLRTVILEELLENHVAGERRSMFFAACEVFDSTELEVIGRTMESLIEQVERASTARELRAVGA